MTHPLSLDMEFDGKMLQVYEDAKEHAGYNATRFLQMVNRRGGVEAAHRLLATNGTSPGFDALFAAGFKHLTAEAAVLEERFRPLFSDAERQIASDRLAGPSG